MRASASRLMRSDECVTDRSHSYGRERLAALVLQRALQTIVETARCTEQLVERLAGSERTRQDREKIEPAEALQIDRLPIERPGLVEASDAHDRAAVRACAVEDRELAE